MTALRYYLKWLAPVLLFAAGTMFGAWTEQREEQQRQQHRPVRMPQDRLPEQGAILVHADLHQTPDRRNG